MSSSTRDTVPTKWDSVNDLMEGGLKGGELGVIVATKGIGKSWTLQALGATQFDKVKPQFITH